MPFKESFGIDGSHATGAGGGDCLPIGRVSNIPCREDPLNVRRSTPAFGEDVSVFVQINLTLEEFRIRLMSDADK